MIRKTDKILRRRSRNWERGYTNIDTSIERYRRETWWFMWVIPLYSRDTVLEKL